MGNLLNSTEIFSTTLPLLIIILIAVAVTWLIHELKRRNIISAEMALTVNKLLKSLIMEGVQAVEQANPDWKGGAKKDWVMEFVKAQLDARGITLNPALWELADVFLESAVFERLKGVTLLSAVDSALPEG